MVIMWRITKPLWETHKMVIMDIGFSLFKGLVGIYDIGVYVSTV